MSLIDEILKLDNDFLQIKNQKIIDAEMDIINQFANKRNLLMDEIKEEFSKNTYTQPQKEQIFNSLKLSSNLIESKIRDIQSDIKKEKMKLLNSRKAYNQVQTSESFFIDKLI